MRAFILRRVGLIRHEQGGVALIGPGHSGDTLRLQRFLTRNSTRTARLTRSETGTRGAFSTVSSSPPSNCPFLCCLAIICCEIQAILSLPTRSGSSRCWILRRSTTSRWLGRAGRARGRRLRRLRRSCHRCVGKRSAGGQAGTSSKIENYLGFPTGISGQALAGRARCKHRSSAPGSPSPAT